MGEEDPKTASAAPSTRDGEARNTPLRAPAGEGTISLFRLNRILHRDIGFLCAGLTILYCLSGIAVNHIDHWNPTYRFDRVTTRLTRGPAGADPDESWIRATLQTLGIEERYRNFFQPSPGKVRIFLENSVVDVDLRRLEATFEKARERPFLAEVNFLHLNKPKKLWTWVADLYALALLYLAVSGLFMVKGDRGVLGRGGLLTLLGFLIPLIFLYLYKF